VVAPAVAPANGVVPTCANTRITAAEQCQAKCNEKISTRSPDADVARESPQTGGSFEFTLCADGSASGSSGISFIGFLAISFALAVAVLM